MATRIVLNTSLFHRMQLDICCTKSALCILFWWVIIRGQAKQSARG